eukprot:g14027.t1
MEGHASDKSGGLEDENEAQREHREVKGMMEQQRKAVSASQTMGVEADARAAEFRSPGSRTLHERRPPTPPPRPGRPPVAAVTMEGHAPANSSGLQDENEAQPEHREVTDIMEEQQHTAQEAEAWAGRPPVAAVMMEGHAPANSSGPQDETEEQQEQREVTDIMEQQKLTAQEAEVWTGQTNSKMRVEADARSAEFRSPGKRALSNGVAAFRRSTDRLALQKKLQGFEAQVRARGAELQSRVQAASRTGDTGNGHNAVRHSPDGVSSPGSRTLHERRPKMPPPRPGRPKGAAVTIEGHTSNNVSGPQGENEEQQEQREVTDFTQQQQRTAQEAEVWTGQTNSKMRVEADARSAEFRSPGKRALSNGVAAFRRSTDRLALQKKLQGFEAQVRARGAELQSRVQAASRTGDTAPEASGGAAVTMEDNVSNNSGGLQGENEGQGEQREVTDIMEQQQCTKEVDPRARQTSSKMGAEADALSPESRSPENVGTDAIVGPMKASVLAACGKKEEAKQTLKNFKESNPIALGIRAVYHDSKGRHEKGQQLRKAAVTKSVAIANVMADATPVVGHAKAGYHYMRKEKEAGDKAMKSASRTTAGVVGAAACAGLGPGAIAGFMAGVKAADGYISSLQSNEGGDGAAAGAETVGDAPGGDDTGGVIENEAEGAEAERAGAEAAEFDAVSKALLSSVFSLG